MAENFRDNNQAQRFELIVNEEIVYANYKLDQDTLYINYVEAPQSLRGTGAASRLMEAIVKRAKEKNYRIVPICSYAAAWLHRHEK